MRKYTPKGRKWLALGTILCFIMLIIGIIMIFVDIPIIGVDIGLIMLGGLIGILFFTCILAEKSRVLIINEEEIIFPRGVIINGKTSYTKTTVKFNEISRIDSTFHKGDKIISSDCYFYTLILKGKSKITFTLFEYGKQAEKEIFEILYNITNK